MERYQDCVLYERLCIACGECDRCDENPEKICDNCMRCVKAEAEYAAIRIDGLLTDEEALEGEQS